MTRRSLAIDNGELSYEIRGSGRPVVLLHGGALDDRTWDAEVALLEAQHTVIRYDARNHGRSSTATAPFSHYDDLRQLLAGLDIDRASLVGLSLGARTAIDTALAFPDLVDKLALIGPGISGMTFTDPFVLDQFARLAVAAAAPDLPAAVECVLRLWVDGPRRAPEDSAPHVRALCQELITDTARHHDQAAQAFVTELRAIDRVAELSAETLVVIGDLDSTDIQAVADLVITKAPNATAVPITGAGHMVNLDQPAAFHSALVPFLA